MEIPYASEILTPPVTPILSFSPTAGASIAAPLLVQPATLTSESTVSTVVLPSGTCVDRDERGLVVCIRYKRGEAYSFIYDGQRVVAIIYRNGGVEKEIGIPRRDQVLIDRSGSWRRICGAAIAFHTVDGLVFWVNSKSMRIMSGVEKRFAGGSIDVLVDGSYMLLEKDRSGGELRLKDGIRTEFVVFGRQRLKSSKILNTAGQSISFFYDKHGELLQVHHFSGAVYRRQRDGCWKLLESQRESVFRGTVLDLPAGFIVEKRNNFGELEMQSIFLACGKVRTLEILSNGAELIRDESNLIVRVYRLGEMCTNFEYDADGKVTAIFHTNFRTDFSEEIVAADKVNEYSWRARLEVRDLAKGRVNSVDIDQSQGNYSFCEEGGRCFTQLSCGGRSYEQIH